MNRLSRSLSVTMGILLLLSAGRAEEPERMTVSESDQGLTIREDGRDVLFYQKAAKSLEGKFERAHYVHPLYGLDGEPLTEDFPDDHPHHRGIFWAWHQLYVGEQSIADGWVCRDLAWELTDAEPVRFADGAAGIRARVLWKSPNFLDAEGRMRPLVEERATIRAYPREDDARAVDFSYQLKALVKGVRLGGSDDEKGYGGFSVRIRLPDGVKFVAADGEAAPRATAVDAGPWVDVVGAYGREGTTGGVAIFSHPTNPGHPQPWLLRSQRSMQNPAWPGREPAALPIGEPLAFRYRLVIHRGDTASAEIARRHAEFAKMNPE